MAERVTGAVKRESFSALTDFRLCWRDCEGWDSHSAANFSTFPADVEYFWKKKTLLFRTTVMIRSGAGPSDGTIELEPTPKVSVNKFHLGFDLNWQSYTFDEATEALTITGRSDKMSGAWKVVIQPDLRHD